MVREKEQITAPNSATLVFIRLVLPAGEAVSAPPLSATLGQVQINSNDFCKQFNALSLARFEAGTLLNVHLFKNSDGTFFFKIRGIFLPFLFFQAAVDSENVALRSIKLEHLFDIFKIHRSSTPPVPGVDNFKISKRFFGALRASRFKVLLLLITLMSAFYSYTPSPLAVFYAKGLVALTPTKGYSYHFLPRYVSSFFSNDTFQLASGSNANAAALRFYRPSPFLLNYLKGSYNPVFRFTDQKSFLTSYHSLPKPARFPVIPLSVFFKRGGSIGLSAFLFPQNPLEFYSSLFFFLLFIKNPSARLPIVSSSVFLRIKNGNV